MPLEAAGDPARRRFVSYIDRSRDYYAARGHPVPYRWATHTDAPFTPLARPVSDCVVGLVTTAKLDRGDPNRPYACPVVAAPASLATGHLFWDKRATHTDDLGSYLPLRHLAALAAERRIRAVAPRFYGAPTVYSQRRTRTDASRIEDWCRADGVDLVLLVPL